MNFLDIAKNRYTTKKYDKNEKISDDKIQQLKEILRLSPSSIDSQPWKFVFVSDEETKEQFAKVSYFNEHKVQDASHIVIFSVIDKIELFEKQIKENLPEGAVNYYNNMLKPKSETEIKTWLRSQVYISLGFFLSACAAMDIDSTPMEGIQTEEYTKLLNLDGYKTLFAVAIGYRNPNDENQPSITPKSRLKIEEVIRSI